MADKNEWIVEGYLFGSPADAEQARAERKKALYFETKLEGKPVKSIQAVYDKMLEEKGIYVSSGSACASNHPQVSGVLRGIGARQEFLDATLRFSMSEFTTLQEIDYTLDTLYNIVPRLRKYTRR